ncbi:hypothetical protein KSD_74880 [Ktedonobacter sp. SOSP1-85]|nr:hypothetical protein KSD_74880 [Ktedonobacter sp. SOSP1-85]
MRITASRDVAVHVKGEHLCMIMRGIRTPATMISTTMQGAFCENSALRADFLRMASTTS